MLKLWSNEDEIRFFEESLKSFASPEQLFYKTTSGYYAYIPKNQKKQGDVLQGRNTLIGKYTEKWCRSLFESIARKNGLFAVNGVICNEIGLTKQSNADLAICKTNEVVQKAENIKMIFEIKMSIVSNYKYSIPDKITYVGDYSQHCGNPSLLRSDSMLKAIGKAINIRVSSINAAIIPIVVLGNTPITKTYLEKVDFLKKCGVIQGFWSLNPDPGGNNPIIQSPCDGFITISNMSHLKEKISDMLILDLNYFSAMLPKTKLGELIKLSAEEQSDIECAEKFLKLIRK